MAIQYTIYYDNPAENPTTGSSATLPIDLEINGDVFYGKYNSKLIAEIHIIYAWTDIGDFTLTGTASVGSSPTIRSVDFTAGSPAPGGGHFRWKEASNVLTLTFEAPSTTAASTAHWEFGRFSAPPTKLKVVVKRQSDPTQIPA